MKTQKTIYIIGAGAIGKALATFLSHEGKEVIILRGSVDDHSDYVEKISIELNNGAEIQADLRISTISNFSQLDGIVVLTNKSYGNQRLAGLLKMKIKNSPIILLQNGLAVEKPFIHEGYSQIYRCVLFATSQFSSINKLRFKPVAVSPVGVIKGDSETLFMIINAINTTWFRFIAEQTIQPVIWTKAIINCVFNSICPLLETDNGIFYRDKVALHIARRIIAECIAIASLQEIFLDARNVEESLLLISKASEGQLISTYQDIANKRRTEIDSLNFAFVHLADELKKHELTKETNLLGELIKIKSGLNCNF